MKNLERACEVCGGAEFSALFSKDDHDFVRCTKCSLERIDPAPSDATLAAIYGKHYYDAWGLHDSGASVARLKRSTFSSVLDQVERSPSGSRLLDCGAATGFLLEVAKERGFEPYGVELSEFGASEIAKKFGDGRAFQGEIESATFAEVEDGFHVVTMCDYIEHVRNPARVLEKARSLLVRGGELVITTPDAGSLSHTVLRSGWTHYKLEHLHYFRRDNITQLLERCGFTQVSFRPLLKALTLGYVREQFEVYPHPVLSRAARLLSRVVPTGLQQRNVRVMTGEMLVTARAS